MQIRRWCQSCPDNQRQENRAFHNYSEVGERPEHTPVTDPTRPTTTKSYSSKDAGNNFKSVNSKYYNSNWSAFDNTLFRCLSTSARKCPRDRLQLFPAGSHSIGTTGLGSPEVCLNVCCKQLEGIGQSFICQLTSCCYQ
jgi:hypothetical protein